MSDPESISSGRTFPQWIKLRTETRSDFDGMAMSPPSHDDSFFYIRYPRGENSNNTSNHTNLRPISDAINASFLAKTDAIDAALSKCDVHKTNTQHHTEPCKMFLDNAKMDPAAPSPVFSNIKNQTKPFGTDDGFKGPGAACGSSIVKVARQFVSHKNIGRGLTPVSSYNNKDSELYVVDTADQTESDDNGTVGDLMQLTVGSSRYSLRRGSKSLPSSPLGSPKSMRRTTPSTNPYFTGQFTVANTNSVAATTSAAVDNRGWFLSSLLGVQREATSTHSVVSNVSEETDDRIVDVDIIPSTKNNSGGSTSNPKVLRAKPSELREMNFWSPTSM